MASREADFHARIVADTALMAILTGGAFKSESVGIEGIDRTTAPGAFDASGFLRPCALVRQRALVPTGDVLDFGAQIISARQAVEIWLYSDASGGYTAIDAAIDRLYTLFQGHVFAGTFEVSLAIRLDRERDQGALQGASMAKLDWQVDSIM